MLKHTITISGTMRMTILTKNNFRFIILHRPTFQMARTGFCNWEKICTTWNFPHIGY